MIYINDRYIGDTTIQNNKCFENALKYVNRSHLYHWKKYI